MNGFCKNLFSGSRFPFNDHRQVRAREPRAKWKQAAHRATAAEGSTKVIKLRYRRCCEFLFRLDGEGGGTNAHDLAAAQQRLVNADLIDVGPVARAKIGQDEPVGPTFDGSV